MALLTRAELTKFQKLIESEDYNSAVTMAENFGLEKDDVYKRQWSSSDFGIEAIRNVLSLVGDVMWVVKECKEKVCPSFEAMNALLMCGLRLTEPYAYTKSSGPSLEGARSHKSWWFRFKRLRILQYKDRLDTFVGVNNGRYTQNDYEIFRSLPLQTIALKFAERGKTGPLFLLFKRHTYSLSPFILQLLDAIPESLSPENYSQMLPAVSPPKSVLPRKNEDWVEKDEILNAIKTGGRGLFQGEDELDLEDSTENMVKLSKGLLWPTKEEVVDWYKERAKEIDIKCGLLENSLSLLDLAVGKGLVELEPCYEDILDLYRLVFSSNANETEIELKLSDWQCLSNYEKFKLILDGATEETAVERLKNQALPFMIRTQTVSSLAAKEAMEKDFGATKYMDPNSQPFLVRWLKETAEGNKLQLCSTVLDECCREPRDKSIFASDEDLVEVSLDCIYSCTLTEEWLLMSSMLAKLPQRDLKSKEANVIVDDVQGRRGLRKGIMKAFRGAVGAKAGDGQVMMAPLSSNVDETQAGIPGSNDLMGNLLPESLEDRLRKAEGHVEAGKLLSQYQVPRPINFFVNCKKDMIGTKRLVHILVQKFSNRESAKFDNNWALLWRDMRTLQEKAFPFLDKEDLLSEFCQGVLKAGKFSLAKNYLKGTGTTILRTENAEKLVLNAAREYFYSAPDLESSSIAKAKQCLNLVQGSKLLTTEINLIKAITEQLPSMGITLLPVQFRQLKDSMEVVRMAIRSHAGAYLNIPEIMELARLLDFNSVDDVLAIEAEIAREADAAGDFVLAHDMCLGLVKKGHGPIWDLCAALGRRSDVKELNLDNRKELIGFALCHCDEDFVSELLSAWKELDLLSSCNNLGRLVGRPGVDLADHERAVASLTQRVDLQQDTCSSDENFPDLLWQGSRIAHLSVVAQDTQTSEQSLKLFVQERKRALWFICLQLPWVLEVLSGRIQMKVEKGLAVRFNFPKECQSLSAQAVSLILHALATNDIVANENLILRLAQEAMATPVSKEGDIVGFGYLLNLDNAYLGAEMLEEELQRRETYVEAQMALELALSFSKLQELILKSNSPKERSDSLNQILREHTFPKPGSGHEDVPVTNFWTNFSIRAVEKLRLAKETRRLQTLLPGVDVGRFISGDKDYIQRKIFSRIDSMKIQQEKGVSEMLTLAEQYNMDQWQVIRRYFLALLGADWATEGEIIRELSGFCSRLLVTPDRLPDTLEVYEDVVSKALGGLGRDGSTYCLEKESVSECKRTLVRALVSLSNDSAPIVEPSTTDISLLDTSPRLNEVRQYMWLRLCHFADDLNAPLHNRIFILELLEAIKNGKVPRMDFWHSCQLEDYHRVLSWGQWEPEGRNFLSPKQLDDNGEKKPKLDDSVNILLTLRSTQIIAKLWPGCEVRNEELSSSEAATRFFNRLLDITSTVEQAKGLKALLEEWESVFGFDQYRGDGRKDATTTQGNDKEDWGAEDWGEGWDEFNENSLTVHTLHSCWKAILQKFTELGGLREALGVLDTALLHPTSVLVTEDEAKDLIATIGPDNPSAALQLSLLLPYNSSQVHGLQMLEAKLNLMHERESGLEGNLQPISQESDALNQDLMALVLSSGLLPLTAEDPSLNMVFSYLCRYLGQLVLQVQELQLSMKPSLSECLVSDEKVPFCAVAFPFFVAELTKTKCYGQAGALVLQFMRVHPALATWNAAYIALQRYLSTQADGASVEALTRQGKFYLKNQGNCLELDYLRNTVYSLVCRLHDVLRGALKSLSKDMK